MRFLRSHHFLPHFHEEENYHRAHAISHFALFLYLQIFIFLTVAAYFFKPESGVILGEGIFSSEEIVRFTNLEREKKGLSNLTVNPLLVSAAQKKAHDMHENDYWSHNSPSGKTPWSFITASDYKYLYAGENLARDFDDPSDVVRAWMNSPSHRSNILDTNFREIGVYVEEGKLTGREGILVVQMFGATSSAYLAENSKTEEKANVENVAVFGEKKAESAPAVSKVASFGNSQVVMFAMVFGIFLLFAIEAFVSMRSSNMNFRFNIIAHLLLLGGVLVALWYSVSGAIA